MIIDAVPESFGTALQVTDSTGLNGQYRQGQHQKPSHTHGNTYAGFRCADQSTLHIHLGDPANLVAVILR